MLLCPARGPCAVVQGAQRDVARLLGGPVVFLGAIDAHQAVLVGRRDALAANANLATPQAAAHMHAAACGDVYVIASDAAGEECDLDVPAACAALGVRVG